MTDVIISLFSVAVVTIVLLAYREVGTELFRKHSDSVRSTNVALVFAMDELSSYCLSMSHLSREASNQTEAQAHKSLIQLENILSCNPDKLPLLGITIFPSLYFQKYCKMFICFLCDSTPGILSTIYTLSSQMDDILFYMATKSCLQKIETKFHKCF